MSRPGISIPNLSIYPRLRHSRQERELQLLDASVSDLRAEVEQRRRRVRELEDQIQSNDRAERLEYSLKNTQDRADELEFQLSKLKQASLHIKKWKLVT
jgi:chromosome segregation ATPase